MRKAVFFCTVLLFTTITTPLHAQTMTFPEKSQSGNTTVNATVGDRFITVTGYQSPNASVVIETLRRIFMSSTTADGNGHFTISELLITDDFPGFCFTAIDFRRVGESESCVEIEKITRDGETYEDIFLPPTIGLSKKLITVGENAQIFGYSMPHAQVNIQFNNETVTIQSDETGYYEYIFENPPAGTYAFSSRGVLGEKTSLDPENKAILEVITLPEKIRDDITGFAQDIDDRFPGILFLAPLLLIFIALLILLFWKTQPKFLFIIFDKFKKRHPMHHDYFLFQH